MTKAYIKFPRAAVNYAPAPRFVSRRFPHAQFMNVAYKDDAPGAEEDKRKEEELFTAIEGRVAKSLEGVATKEELVAIRASMKEQLDGVDIAQLRAMADDKTGVMAMLTRQGLEMQRLESRLAAMSTAGKDMSVRGQIATWMEDNKEAIKNARKTRSLPPMELRLDSPMFTSTVNSASSPYIGRIGIEPGVNDIIRIQPNFWDYIKKGRTNNETIVWVNKTNPLGAAAFIGPGVAKPGVSFSLVSELSHAKKIADSAKAGTEVLQDIEQMKSFIEDELRYQIFIKLNAAVMAGVSSSTDINGIQTLSIPFPATGSGIVTDSPNFMDAIRAGVGYLRSGLLQGDITVFINPIDATNMDMAKSGPGGVYLLPPFVTSDGRKIGGATIVEDYNVAVGSVQFAFLRYYRIMIYKDLFVEWGWENDDFTKNLVTAIGEMRLHQFFNSIYTGAFIYDTFANIKAAITAP